jgi:DNA-directed RNA polymerase subunit D
MIELLDKDKKTGKARFLLKDSTPAFANALRRAMMDLVPTMAIDEVTFNANSSALYDEILAHRLGLLPLRTDLKSYTIKAECTCKGEGCAKCTLLLTLRAKGPCTVYAEDIKSKDPKVKPVFPQTPIVTLLKGQELEFEATAILGRARTHVKFSPCLAWYVYKPTITVNNTHPQFAEFKEKYPPQIFKDNKIDPKLIEQYNLYEAVEGINDEIVKVERDPTTFIFNIEPWGQLSPAEILATAAQEFTALLTDFEQKLG